MLYFQKLVIISIILLHRPMTKTVVIKQSILFFYCNCLFYCLFRAIIIPTIFLCFIPIQRQSNYKQICFTSFSSIYNLPHFSLTRLSHYLSPQVYIYIYINLLTRHTPKSLNNIFFPLSPKIFAQSINPILFHPFLSRLIHSCPINNNIFYIPTFLCLFS